MMPSGCRRPSGRDWRRWGCATCWTFPAAPRSGRRSQPGPVRSIRGSGVPASPGWRAGSGAPWRSAVPNCRRRPGGRPRWRREARVPAATSSAPSGCGRPVSGSLAKSTGPSTAGTGTAASPVTACPTLRRTFPGRPWPTWEGRGGALKPSSRRKKAMWGWMSTRPEAGWDGIITWPGACWAERFC